MPVITADIRNTEKTVTREAVLSIVYDLITAMGIPYNVKILYPGSDDPEDLPMGDVDNSRDIKYDPEVKIVVTADEEYLDDAATAIMQDPKENSPIFKDPYLGVRISPVYAKTELTVSVTFKLPNKSAAERQMSDIRRNTVIFRDGLMHELKYYYFIPKTNLVILKAIHDLRETQAPYGETLAEYFNLYMNDQVTVLSDRAGKNKAIGKNEIQMGIVGKYNFDIVPEKAVKDAHGAHDLTFEYVVRYDKAISTVMEYPLAIHNQAISSKFYDSSHPYELGLRLNVPCKSRLLLDAFTDNGYVTPFKMGAPVPTFNVWQPHSVPNHVEGMLRIMLLANPLDLQEVVNLTELGELTLTDDMIAYLKLEHLNLTTYKECPLFLAIYEDDKILDGDSITVDADLNVRTTFDLKLRSRYQLFLGIVTKLDMVNTVALDQLRNDPTMTNSILLSIDSTLDDKNLLPPTINDVYVTKAGFDKVVQYINRKTQPILGSSTYGNFRIGQFVIKA